jgi:hypothetical protein
MSYFTLELPPKCNKSVYWSEIVGSSYINQPTKSINMQVLQAKRLPFSNIAEDITLPYEHSQQT